MERAVILSDRAELRPDDLQIGSVAPQAATEDRMPPPYEAVSLDELERRHILQTLRATNWVKREAARVLGINRSTLDRKLERYGLADGPSSPPT